MADTSQETALRLPLRTTVSEESPEAEVVALFEELRGPLLGYLATLGVPVQEGEEVVQEAFLALFRHLRHGKSRENLRGWMFRVAHNVGLKRLKKNKRWDPSPETVAIADSGPSPEEAAADQQKQQQLRAVVRALPEQDRRCLVLRAEGLRYREIAGVLNMSLGAVSMSLARSLARLARVAER
ncbi:MAG TPA: sigma-70 family RNA polymerase sigma factor [Bryobacteraceae bacterium]|nr:sigma-70 family RNA polymerase sigma factor [Bryobacteraceae bacterium]